MLAGQNSLVMAVIHRDVKLASSFVGQGAHLCAIGSDRDMARFRDVFWSVYNG